MDSFQELSLDADCILAVDAKNGGTWHSSFRPASLRNFYASNMTWADLGVAQSLISYTDNASMYLKFYWNSTLSNNGMQILYNTISGCRFSCYCSTTGILRVFTNLLESVDGKYVTLRLAGNYLTPGVHTIRASVTGLTLTAQLDEETPVSVTATQRYNGTLLSSLFSYFDGSFIEAKITNDTTSTIVWQASYSQLHNSDAIYPSAVPRNFATEPATWHDFVRAWNAYIITDDVSVKVRFVFKEMPTTQFAVFGVKGSTIHFVAGDGNNGGRVIMGCGFWYTATSTRFINYVFYPVVGQIYTAEFKKIGNVESVFLDGVQVATRTETISTSVPVPYYLNTPRSETFNGNVLSVELENLTTGKTVWQYPSFEERARLITKSNVWTANGVFEPAASTVAARIDTQLDLRGRVSSYTSVVRFTAANLTADTTKQELAGQGSGITITERPAICAIAYHRTNATTYGVQINQEIGGARVAMSGAIAGPLSGMHVAVGVVEVRTTQTVLSVYLDGTLLKTQTYNGRPTGLAYSGFPNFSINDNRAGAWTNYFGKIHEVVLLSKALSEGQVRAYTYDNTTVLDIDITTVSNNEEVVLSDSTTTLTSDLIINWGDGTVERVIRTSLNYTKISHVYTTAGNYKITANGRLSLSHANGATKTAWRYINKFDMVKMGFISCNYTFQAPNLVAFNTDIIFPDYVKSCLNTFYQVGCDIPSNIKLPDGNTIAFSLFNGSKITRIRNGFTFGNIQPNGNSFAYLCYGCTELVEVEDGVKYPASLTASATTQTTAHYANCAKLTHLSVNLFDDLNIDNLTGNALYAYVRYSSKLKNLPNNLRFSALITNLGYFAHNCYELEWDITDKFPVFPVGSSIVMDQAFMNCYKITGYVDPAKLWKRTDITWASTTSAFEGCTSLTNYDEIPASWGGLATVSISTNRTWTDVWGDKTVNITSTGSLTCVDNKGIINMVSGSVLNITTNTGTINYVSGSIINAVTKTESGTLTGSL